MWHIISAYMFFLEAKRLVFHLSPRVSHVIIVSGCLACVASVSVRFRSKERGTRVKDRVKTEQVKERGGVGKKGRKRLQTNQSILKTAHLACHAWVHALTFDAVISCRNWPIKWLSFEGAEMNFRGECVKPKYIFFLYFGTRGWR